MEFSNGAGNRAVRNRRQFLKTLVWTLFAGVWTQEAVLAEENKKYRIAPWTGDNFNLGHKLREGNFSISSITPIVSETTVEFVIVGGGIAGLTSAYNLRNHDFLLLEQYDELGGQSQGRSYRGIEYSLGAACMNSKDGIFGELFNALNIKPTTIPSANTSWYLEGKWLPGIEGSKQSLFYRQLNQIIAESKRALSTGNDSNKLDSVLFSSYLQSYKPEFIAMMDSFCKAIFCASINQISALAGFNLIQDLVNPKYVFKGGNSALASALKNKIGAKRSITNAFVWRIDASENKATVIYSTGNGQFHKVNCKHVIVTTPPLVAARLIPELDDKTKALLLWQKYGSYLVANFCMPKKIFDSTYESWVDSPFTFADIVIAETPYLATNSYKPEMGSVLTVYQPYSNASQGRPLLLAGNREEFASSLIKQLSQLVPQFEQNLEEVVLTRWGHAMVIAAPGMFAKIAQLQACDTGALSLAHNSIYGLPSAESAIMAARHACNRALGKKT